MEVTVSESGDVIRVGYLCLEIREILVLDMSVSRLGTLSLAIITPLRGFLMKYFKTYTVYSIQQAFKIVDLYFVKSE